MTMRSITIAILALVLMTGASCEKKNDGPSSGTLELRCKATFGGEDLIIGKAFAYPLNNSALKFYLVDYLLSNVRLVDGQGKDYVLNEVDIIDFSQTNTDPAKAAAGITLRFEGIPVGTYPSLVVGVGVDTVVNRTKPQDYPSGHPLSIGANRYWDAWSSFIFTKTQGLADINGTGVFSLPFSYHTGGDGLYREITFQHSTVIKGGQVTTAGLDLDVRALLQQQDGNYWDIEAQPNAHTPGEPAMLLIMDNYQHAFSMF